MYKEWLEYLVAQVRILPLSRHCFRNPKFLAISFRHTMRRQRLHLRLFAFFTAALLATSGTTRGQGTLVHEVDTLTAGDSEERNPSMQHNAFFGPPTQWLVFERTAEGMTSICGMRLDNEVPAWQSGIVQISGLLPAGAVRNPDIAGTWYPPKPLRFVAWEQWTSNRWNIHYSTRSDTDLAWSEPRSLTEDTVDNTGIQLRPLDGEHILATWRRGKDLIGSRIGYSGRTDTFLIGTSTIDNFNFDVIADTYVGSAVLWVTQDSLGKRVFAYRSMSFDYFGRPTFQPIEYLTFPFPVDDPWLVVMEGGGTPMVVFEGPIDNRRHVLISYGTAPADISADESADYGNPVGFFNPIVTSSRTKGALRREAFWINGVLVVEREGPADSSLVIWPGYVLSADTLKGPGANRNAVVGSPWILLYPWAWVPVVWESNRTGQWHLYGTFARLSVDDVPDQGVAPFGFSLAQNYPNPFNAGTTIRYEVARSSMVRLSVFDLLGREVTVLVNERRDAGIYEVRFDCSDLASGVYFYALTAGGVTQVRRLVLLR